MKYLRIGLFLLMIWAATTARLAFVVATEEQTLPGLLITEIMTGSEVSASEEYVEIVNSSNELIENLAIEVQYKSASGTSWTTKGTSELSLPAHDHYLFATDLYQLQSDAVISSGLAGSGGHVRIIATIDDVEVVLDKVGWGSAIDPEGTAVAAPDRGQSIKRLLSEDGQFVDSDDNSLDLFISNAPHPTPSSIETPEQMICEPVENPEFEESEEGSEEEELSPVEQPPQTQATYETIHITELMIDPSSPAVDKEDEFVELYNPNPFAVQLSGYQIQTGSEFNYSFILPSYLLQPGEYLAVYAVDSGLTLSNAGGAARLLDPAGKTKFTAVSYQKAKAGQSWAVVKGTWVWTDIVTPHAENQKSAVDNEESGVLAKRTAVQSISESVSLASISQEAPTRDKYVEPPLEEDPALNNQTLAVVFIAAILYFVYEYRQEISSGVQRLRGYLSSWRANRSST